MEKVNVVAVAKLTYRQREHLAIIRPYDGVLLLQTPRYADELRDYQHLRPHEYPVFLPLAFFLLSISRWDRYSPFLSLSLSIL